MQTVVEAIITGIVFVVQVVPIGTNISLARLLWMLVNGSLLVSRGATHGGCKRVRLHQKKSAVASDFRRVLLQTTVKQT